MGPERRDEERTTDESRAAKDASAGGREAGGGAPGARRRRAGEPHVEPESEGLAGTGERESGTLPGSVGGTTGTAGHSGGIQAPGATIPGRPGISPDEARRRRAKRRASEEREQEGRTES